MGSVNRRLIDKLIKASGGWEKLLYKTLKDVYSAPSAQCLTAALEEAKDILEAYEECMAEGNIKQTEVASAPVDIIGTQDASVRRSVYDSQKNKSELATKSSQLYEDQTSLKVEKSEITYPERNPELEEICRVVTQLSLEGSKLKSKPQRAVVRVDNSVGQSQGTLPIPGGYQIVNRDKISIRTKSNLILGGGQPDGQIKNSNHVSGLIQANGKYSLVFKDTTLGSAVINYEIQQDRKSKELEFEMVSVADETTSGWVSYIRSLEVLRAESTLEDAKKGLLTVLEQDRNMKVISVVVTKRTKEQEAAMKQRKTTEHLI